MRTRLTHHDTAQLLTALANGTAPEELADAFGITAAQVLAVATGATGRLDPTREQLHAAAHRYAHPPPTKPAPTRGRAHTPHRPPPSRPADQEPPMNDHPPTIVAGELTAAHTALTNAARAAADGAWPKTVTVAIERATKMVEAAQAKVEAEEAAALAKAKVDRLTAELDRAKKALAQARGANPPQARPTPRVDAAAVRTWATANGIACPARGVVPTRVVDAYQAAHKGAAA